jgi:Flp pilus assembly protein TadG
MKTKPIALITESDFIKGREGTAATELALSLMFLVPILFGITTFGWMFYQDNNWETAAREAARRLASGEAIEILSGPVTCGDPLAQDDQYAVYFACDELPNWGAIITVDASSLCVDDGLGNVDPLLSDQAVSVTVSANAEDVAITDIFGYFNGATLDATVEMYQECSCIDFINDECEPPPTP